VLLLGQVKEDCTENPQQVYASSTMRPGSAVLLWDQVKENRAENHKFERNWLKAKHKIQAEAIRAG
jgi:hypothetical protein